MLWLPRRTRSGAIFADFLQSPFFSINEPLAAAVAVESDAQEDHEVHDEEPDELNEDHDHHDPLSDIDDLSPPSRDNHNPLGDINDLPPPRKKMSLDFTKPPAIPGKGRAAGAHRRRQAKRNAKIIADGHKPRAAAYKKHVSGAQPIPTGLNPASDLPAAQGGYVATSAGRKEAYGSKKRRSVEEFLLMGFQLIRWNGIDARPLVDQAGRIFAVLAGQPDDPRYAGVVQNAYNTLVREAAAARFPSLFRKHRRGLFAALSVGLSYGQGQTEALWLKSNYPETAEALLADPNLQEMASFATAMFAFWAPRLHGYYVDYNKRLNGRRPFLKSVFSCATFNFGPNAWTFKHRDVLNLPFGWCPIQALGNFDPTKGGHLILWDLKLIIEFPPGALILIPSATLTHSNIPVQKGEERASFTQFTAGGLFRFVDNGFRTEDELKASDPVEWAKVMERKETRWRDGVELWSTIDELDSLAK